MQMMAQFAEFKKTMQGKNPEAIVKQMLANGQMSQAQFEQLKVHIETTRYIAVPCHVNSPAYGVTSSGVAGTVTHVTGYAVKLD